MADNKRKIGAYYEALACRYLAQKGFVILQQNFRVRQGEIDIIANDHGTLVFVEVKYRNDCSKGLPEEAVGIRKQRQICKVCLFYLSFHHIPTEHPIRFDVIAMNPRYIRWIPNAFEFVQ